jgi:hypothetical protein
MAELKGMTGKIARVNLTTGEITTIEPAEEIYRKYLGGSALGVYFLFKEGILNPEVDPLGPDNMLQFMIACHRRGPQCPPVTGLKARQPFPRHPATKAPQN